MQVRLAKGEDYVLKPKTCVFCLKVADFLSYVMEVRGKGITTILIGADSGKGSFKVCVNCVEELAPEEYRGPKKASSTRSQKYHN